MPRLLRTVARTAVISGTATAVSGRVARRQNNRWAAKEEEQYQQQAAQASAASAPVPAGEDSLIDQLKQLGELRDQGILTDDEFAAQKAKLLG
jgi:Short C-terminal domain